MRIAVLVVFAVMAICQAASVNEGEAKAPVVETVPLKKPEAAVPVETVQLKTADEKKIEDAKKIEDMPKPILSAAEELPLEEEEEDEEFYEDEDPQFGLEEEFEDD
nr:uncharacterized protein LOC128695531 [Cherax quadricarinatus]